MEPQLIFVDEPIYMRETRGIREITNNLEETHLDPETKQYTILSVDVGIIHLGLTVSVLDEEYSLVDIVFVDLIDITNFLHNKVQEKDCKLHHDRTFCDWLNHVFQEHMELFDSVDYILIERQPPTGLVGIEQLIFSKWRNKAVLISPSSMHKHFNIGHYDYEQRKEQTELISLNKITDKKMLKKMKKFDRLHDIADSICMTLFWASKKYEEFCILRGKQRLKEISVSKEISRKKMSVDTWFELHRFVPSK